MKVHFLGIEWKNNKPLFHIHDINSNVDYYIDIPEFVNIQKQKDKICIGNKNPITGEFSVCKNIVAERQIQCFKCSKQIPFFNCVKCHGNNCNVDNDILLDYCNSPHYVYLAYFSGEKIKVGTASEIRKQDRLQEQGTLFSIFIARAPSGKIARQIENWIIKLGITGVVSSKYKMKNLTIRENSVNVYKSLLAEYSNILNLIDNKYKKYFIDPEYNHYDDLSNTLTNIFNIEEKQMSLFDEQKYTYRDYIINNNIEEINGKVLCVIGKIIIIEDNGIIQVYDTKRLEGFVIKFFEYDKNLLGGGVENVKHK